MKKIKVLHIIGALNLGGAETMAVNIMRNIDRERFQFDFYLSGNSGGYYESEVKKLGGNIINIGRRKKKPIKYCVELYKTIKERRYEIVQIHASTAMDGLPAFVAKVAGVKKVCLFSHSSSGQSDVKQKLLRALFNKYITHPQACSDFAAEWMFGKEKKRARIIPLPINCKSCEYDEEVAKTKREKLNINDCIVVGHIGRICTPKNHLRLLEIFAELYKRNKKYRLVLIGTGELEQQVCRKIEELGIQQGVLMLGQIGKACKELSMFDIMIFPSLYEGMPTVLLEAQANALPIVVSNSVTDKIALTDLVVFESLESNNQTWADVIEKHLRKRKNVFQYNQDIATYYDEKIVAKEYEKIYGE